MTAPLKLRKLPKRKDPKKADVQSPEQQAALTALKYEKFYLEIAKNDMKDLWDILDTNVLKLKEHTARYKCVKFKAIEDKAQAKLDVKYAICESMPTDLQPLCKAKAFPLQSGVSAAKAKVATCETALSYWQKFLYYSAASIKYVAYYTIKAM